MSDLHDLCFCAESQASILQSPAGDSSLCTREPKEHRRNCVSGFFIGDRAHVSSVKHFNRSKADRRRCAAADDRKKTISARRGVDRKAGRFFSPRLRVLLWSFLPTREESGVPEMKERTIYSPANPQICRRWEVQRKRIAAGVSRPRGGGCRKCISARNKTSSGFASLNHLPCTQGKPK